MLNFNFIRLCGFSFFALLLISCQPVELKYAGVITAPSVETNQEKKALGESGNKRSLLTRSAQKKFKEHFLSDKLDLVFVLDTSPGMEVFYQNNPFGSGFLNQFQNYDWKLAYTDMSVDVKKISEQKNSKDKSCNVFSGLAMAAGGIFIGSGAPLLAGLGFKELGSCGLFKSSKSKSGKTDYANGAFLPFEHNGKALETKSFHQITKETANYNIVFDHSFSLKNEAKKAKYSAPILKKTQAYPFLSMFFSIARALTPAGSSEGETPLSFFREDSLIVYVLVSVQDIKIQASPEQFTESLKSAFGNKNRFKFIPITLTKNSSLFCSLKLQESSTDSEKLLQLTQNLNYPSLDICSNKLGEKLFNEISKNLHSKKLLNQ